MMLPRLKAEEPEYWRLRPRGMSGQGRQIWGCREKGLLKKVKLKSEIESETCKVKRESNK